MWQEEGPLGKWREAFALNPAEVLARTLDGGWYFGALNPIDPEQLLWEMVVNPQEGDTFPEQLDPALAVWIGKNASELSAHQRAKLEPMIRGLAEKGFEESRTAFDRTQPAGTAP